jgi:hypothetical protein
MAGQSACSLAAQSLVLAAAAARNTVLAQHPTPARRVVRRDRPVIAISEYAYFAACLRSAGHALKVIDAVEVFQRDYESRQRLGFTMPMWPSAELRALNQADVVIAL